MSTHKPIQQRKATQDIFSSDDDESDDESAEEDDVARQLVICKVGLKRGWERIEQAILRHNELEEHLDAAEHSIKRSAKNKRTLTDVLNSDLDTSLYFQVEKRLKESNTAHLKIARIALKKILKDTSVHRV
jgi:hypothetical protein